MIGITARVSGDAAAIRELERLGRAMGNDAAETTRIVGRSVAGFGMRESYPRGVGGKSKKQGENSIARDARKVLGQSPGGSASATEAYAHVQAYRNKSGRVSSGQRGRRGRLDPRVLWVTPEAFAEATARRQAMVGWGKAAWAKAATELGAKPPQAWIRRHTAAKGYADLSRKITGPSLTIGSRTSYASDLFNSSMQARAIRNGTKNAIRWMQRQVDGAARKTSQNLKR
jgi:hypothetical protein